MKAPKRKLDEPDFVTKSELAFHVGASTEVLDDWIAKNSFPPPICRPGERHSIWLRRHYNAFRDTGRWPREAWPPDWPESHRQANPSM